jgi:hypothetical protein
VRPKVRRRLPIFSASHRAGKSRFCTTAGDQFAGLQGDVIVTGEFGSNSPVTDLHWNGSSVVETLVGNLPNQSEDGIFVTAQRIRLVGTPEPSTWAMMLLGFAGLGLAGYRARKRASPLVV